MSIPNEKRTKTRALAADIQIPYLGFGTYLIANDADRIRENADVFGFDIDDEDMAAIAKMDRGDGVAWPMGDPTKAP
jgi:hypothetical protein